MTFSYGERMSELRVTDDEGKLTADAAAVAISAMHLPDPEDKKKRGQLADYYRCQELLKNVAPASPDHDDGYSLLSSEIETLRNARPLHELIADRIRHFRDGFIAAHWLLFRLFAAANYPALNSTGRWEDYAATYLMPILPKQARLPRDRTWDWLLDPSMLRDAVRRFGPVAHLWAAAIYNQPFRERLLKDANSIDRNLTLAMASLVRNRSKRFLQEARGYYLAAIDANLFSRRAMTVPLERMWTLPESIDPIMPVVDHPDHLLAIENFDQIHKIYVPRNLATAGSREENYQTVAPRLVACPPRPAPPVRDPERDPDKIRRSLSSRFRRPPPRSS